ncbi:hypothetical protein NVP2275O_227 [Vibrio phage 2.275.O._10N.286.54.E11]|nr:hypothetical protein NVP2275O_227 [Vibrio phage 2.275.O._10N.286.54.E11]
MKKILIPFILAFSGSVFAHPVNDIVSASNDLDNNMPKIETCYEVIKTEPSLVSTSTECDYVAESGARILEILVASLEEEGIEVTKENRRELLGIAWGELNLFEFIDVSTTALKESVEETSKYVAKNHPEMVMKYLTKDTIQKLEQGGII